MNDSSADSATRTPFVLIVEDTSDLAGIIAEILETLGLDFYHAPDGRAALEFLAEYHPDLILLDIGLPDISGWQVLNTHLEGYELFCPVIVLTAFDDPANKLIGKLHKHISVYMTKPFTPSELRDEVVKLLRHGPPAK